MTAKLFWREKTGSNKKAYAENARHFHLLGLVLNALYLDLNYCNAYGVTKDSFYRTVDNFFAGLVNNKDEDATFIFEHFVEIYPDFSSDFLSAVYGRLMEIKKKKEESSAPSQPCASGPSSLSQ